MLEAEYDTQAGPTIGVTMGADRTLAGAMKFCKILHHVKQSVF